jgi:hypothetical protein
MDTAQVTEIAPNAADRESHTTDPPLNMGDKLVVILFLIGVALFGSITIAEFATSLFH